MYNISNLILFQKKKFVLFPGPRTSPKIQKCRIPWVPPTTHEVLCHAFPQIRHRPDGLNVTEFPSSFLGPTKRPGITEKKVGVFVSYLSLLFILFVRCFVFLVWIFDG